MVRQTERWNLQNIPSELKQEVIKIGKTKGYDFTNDFIIEILNKYLDDEKLNENKNYFDQRWEEVIQSFKFMARAQNKNAEIIAQQNQIIEKNFKELQFQIEVLTSIQQMFIGYNIEDSQKFAKRYQEYFKEKLPNQSDLDFQEAMNFEQTDEEWMEENGYDQ
ncbi:hypothetical protein QUD55_02560 [Lactococcus lactis]|uniref:hypothetical protein n=1 Tax=Lactococcus lactis TaxID=1358 RepID=UPI0025A0D46C|nr:hypothetical protein [Lactococcus lactis]MDM7536357.1 hypothetical protein [Lactococcus lactis]